MKLPKKVELEDGQLSLSKTIVHFIAPIGTNPNALSYVGRDDDFPG